MGQFVVKKQKNLFVTHMIVCSNQEIQKDALIVQKSENLKLQIEQSSSSGDEIQIIEPSEISVINEEV